jgi:type VI secretion system secreted protein VgrG
MGKKFTQANRPLAISVKGLEPDTLLLVEFHGDEALSTLFRYRLHAVAENPAQVPFEKILGKSVTVELELPGSKRPRENKRTFGGICQRVTQGQVDKIFTHYYIDVVPTVWLLTKVARSRVFQHADVHQILRRLAAGHPARGWDNGEGELDLGIRMDFRLSISEWKARDFCVQYRESDFNFMSRLMAEEGIFYYFQHNNLKDVDASDLLIFGDRPAHHDFVTPSDSIAFGTSGDDGTGDITSWEKMQELRAGSVTLRDHTFEKPDSYLEVSRPTRPSVLAGGVTHKLNTANEKLELYDYPGQYAKRFDTIDKGGASEDPKTLSDLAADGLRTAQVRIEQENSTAVAIHGTSNCRHFVAGHKFILRTDRGTLEDQLQATGDYVLTSVQHSFGLPGGYTSGDNKGFYYRNTFTCVPAALPYRALRTVPKPIIAGTQTAVVVGPKDGEVYTDKYGRVKVQFFWDREGKKDLDSSCWIRVGQFWAGKRWGAHFWPRVGQEVIVAFEEGDPDQPIIVGSVYNAENMPPYEMSENQTRSGIKTRSTPAGKDDDPAQHFNEIRFEDKKGAEELFVQAERTMNVLVKGDENRATGGDRTTRIYGGSDTHIKGDDNRQVAGDSGMYTLVQNGHYTFSASKGGFYVETKDTMGVWTENIVSLNGKKGVLITADEGAIYLSAKKEILLSCGGGSIRIDSGGNIAIFGTSVSVNGAPVPASPPAPANPVPKANDAHSDAKPNGKPRYLGWMQLPADSESR